MSLAGVRASFCAILAVCVFFVSCGGDGGSGAGSPASSSSPGASAPVLDDTTDTDTQSDGGTHTVGGDSQPPVEPLVSGSEGSFKVGVLLPLKGKAGAYGAHARKIMTLAQKAGGKNLTLVFQDLGATEAYSIAAVDELVKQHGVSALMVPALDRARIKAPIEYAAAQNIPVLLTEYGMPVELEGHAASVIRYGLMYRDQIETLTMQARGKRAAVLYPNTGSGKFFKDELVARLKTSLAVEYAEGDINSMVKSAKSLVRNVRNAPSDYAERLKSCEEPPLSRIERTCKANMKANTAGYEHKLQSCVQVGAESYTRRCTKQLNKSAEATVAKFDVLYVPARLSDLAHVIGGLAYAGVDLDAVRIVGHDAWNVPGLLDVYKSVLGPVMGNPEKSRVLDGVSFTAGFFAGAKDPETKSLVSRFRKAFKRVPGTTEADLYKSVLIMSQYAAQRSVPAELLSKKIHVLRLKRGRVVE